MKVLTLKRLRRDLLCPSRLQFPQSHITQSRELCADFFVKKTEVGIGKSGTRTETATNKTGAAETIGLSVAKVETESTKESVSAVGSGRLMQTDLKAL